MSSSSSSEYGVELPPGAVPLIVAPVQQSTSTPQDTGPSQSESQSPNFVLFAYADKLKNPEDKNPTPYLIEHPLDSVPPQLQEYLAPYPVKNPSKSTTTASTSSSSGLTSTSDKDSENLASSSSTASVSSSVSLSRNNSISSKYPRHLRYMTIINSTHSGVHRSSDIYFAILAPLLQRFGMSHVYVATSSPSSIPNHACSFTDPSTVVILAGDTSISEFINCLEPQSKLSASPNSATSNPLSASQSGASASGSHDLPLNLIVIPTGTGNALANSSGLDSIPKAISRMFLGTPKPLASFQVEFPHGTTFIRHSSTPSGGTATSTATTRVSTSQEATSTHLSVSTSASQSTSSYNSPISTPDAPPGSHSSLYNHLFGLHTSRSASGARSDSSKDSYFEPPLTLNAICVVSWGAHASLVADSDSPELRHLGEARFRKAAEENMARTQRYRGKLVLGQEDIRPNASENNKEVEVKYLNPFQSESTSGVTTPTTADNTVTPSVTSSTNSVESSQPSQTPLPPTSLTLPYSLSPDHGYLLFSLVSNIERTYAISPSSKPPSDLTLHLVHTDYTDNARLGQMMMAPYTYGSHLKLGKDVQYYSFAYHDKETESKYLKVEPNTKLINNQPIETTPLSPLAAEIYPEETNEQYQRWCVDGALLKVPNGMGPIKIRLPTYTVHGWSIYVVT